MRAIIAIDPGKGGGIAIYNGRRKSLDGGIHNKLEVFKMPQTPKDLYESLHTTFQQDTVVYLEKVHAMPRNGSISAFKLGNNLGQLEMAITALGCRLIYVTPQKWMKHFSLTKTNKTETPVQHKNKIKAFAQQRYPNIKVTLAISDALALLEYAKEKEL